MDKREPINYKQRELYTSQAVQDEYLTRPATATTTPHQPHQPPQIDGHRAVSIKPHVNTPATTPFRPEHSNAV
ncbi:jg9263 [Pararge aegeria aegeria]|uniref:Jg9263 protein n=1 Tax=Pararge aegeria aegeria TaxID=348720 RepID=A0A8S4SHT7_9NEOP|nr:jg9263 [Pararge aegeria aegeria]